MKKIILLFSFALSMPAFGSNFPSQREFKSYACYWARTNDPVARISLDSASNLARIQILGEIYSGTYAEQRGSCPSRLCGTSSLDLKAHKKNPAQDSVHFVQARFYSSGGMDRIVGSFALHIVGGRAPDRIEAHCRAQLVD